MSDVFISYANEDHDRAGRLASALEGLGWSVWWDRDIITGQAYDQVIERELYRAKSVIVLWSAASVSSEWVRNEAAAASERGVLLPVLIERVPPPLEFRRKQTADLVGWGGDPSHGGFKNLCAGISNTTRATASNPPVTPPWQRALPKRVWAWAAVAATVVALIIGVYLKGPWRAQVPASPGQDPASQSTGNAPQSEPNRTSPPQRAPEPRPVTGNLLAAENGGQLLLAPSDEWGVTLDGNENERQSVRVGEEAVFGFKDERAATFDAFGMLIPRSGHNPKEFELMAADESPTGPFRSIGTFRPQDLKVFQTGGWQDFKFPPVTARYLKVKLRSTHEDGGVWIELYEFRLQRASGGGTRSGAVLSGDPV